jgi:hypothetical protein
VGDDERGVDLGVDVDVAVAVPAQCFHDVSSRLASAVRGVGCATTAPAFASDAPTYDGFVVGSVLGHA